MKTGTSVHADLLKNEKYTKILTNFDYLYSDAGFDTPKGIEKAKWVSEFAINNGKHLRGNCLVSHYHSCIKSRIKPTIMQFPEILEWEAAHEFIGDNGFFRKGCDQNKLEEIFFIAKETIGSSGKSLYYADYYRSEEKWEKTYKILEEALSKSCPIDGLSVQLMSNLRPSLKPATTTLNLDITRYWIKKIKNDFKLKIVAPETVVWQPVNFRESAQFVLDTIYYKYGYCDIKKESLRSLANLLLVPFNVDHLQYQAYKNIIDAVVPYCEMVGFWSTYDNQWNWVGNRANAGLWDADFNPKKSASVLSIFQ